MRTWRVLVLGCAVALLPLTVVAQQRGAGRGFGPRPDGPPGMGRDAVGGRFETVAPALGEPMPDVAVYDRDGNELRLRELLREHTTVLVLGCLT